MEFALAELRRIRESGLRSNSRVVEIWCKDVEPKSHKLGQEKWVILEQVFVAALDVGNGEVAKSCLKTLRTRFPQSSRVDRLLGMFCEFERRYDQARTVYNKILEDDPANTVARKRFIAILKAQGQIKEAVDELNKYLKVFMADTEAWGELADLYLQQGDFKHAAFCVEEMMLASPHNHLLHQRLAEIKYTEGGTENLEISRSYFAQACLLNPTNLRALFGLLLVSSILTGVSGGKSSGGDVTNHKGSAILSLSAADTSCNELDGGDGGGRGKDKCENRRLAIWASKRVAEIYANAGFEPPFRFQLKLHSKPEIESLSAVCDMTARLRCVDQNGDLSRTPEKGKIGTVSPADEFTSPASSSSPKKTN
uniref:ER membrane protein complex subunit 2 n=1 Tax=Schistocephalus solidus TaxID=70667 RepID=A0A0V0J7N1_SCHSO